MIYTPMTKKAVKIMYENQKNQYDKSGLPYVFHPFHVAEQAKDEDTTIVALLHDLIEDTDYTFEDLKREGFSEEVINALIVLTHRPDVDYQKYIEMVGTNDIARYVKIKDLEHNMDLTRLNDFTSDDAERLEKYKQSYFYLLNIEKEALGVKKI